MRFRNGTSWSGRCEAIPDGEEDGMGNCAGVDWAGEKHDVRVCDEAGEELLAATFVHDEKGLRVLCRTLVRLKVQLVAIERPDGLLVERLLDAGLRGAADASQTGRRVAGAVPCYGRTFVSARVAHGVKGIEQTAVEVSPAV